MTGTSGKTGLAPGTMTFTLKLLADKDVRFGTVIDIGCADGSFIVGAKAEGLLKRSAVLNIDANDLYEPSLQAIQKVLGGHYFIGAITDSDSPGGVEMALSSHPYWASIRPEGDAYWERLNGMRGATKQVPATTLDALAGRLELKPPFLLKLDVQGAEQAVLAGAAKTLAATDLVICEADIADFAAIHAALAAAGFTLYDLTETQRLEDGTLGWFYPIYVKPRLSHVLPRSFWRPSLNEAVIRMQADRRAAVLKHNAAALRRLARK